MTNIFKNPRKITLRDQLFNAGQTALADAGWRVSRVPGMGKSSVRRIEKDGEEHLVSIRTTQDQFIAFPPKPKGKGWVTLDDVDAVIAVSVDANVPPKAALVHWLPGDEMRQRFNRALRARADAGHSRPPGRGIWVPLYIKDDDTVRHVGGGAGLDHPAMAKIPLRDVEPSREAPGGGSPQGEARGEDDEGSVIDQAKRMISQRIGIPESAIRITIEA